MDSKRFIKICSASFFFVGVMVLTACSKPDIVGVWQTEPVLQQLGFIQDTFEFKSDGKFEHKSDFQSFCGRKAVNPDCVYFWFMSEGDYVLNDKTITMTVTNMRREMLEEGEKSPKVNIDKIFKSQISTYTYSINNNQLTFINGKGKVLPAFKKIS